MNSLSKADNRQRHAVKKALKEANDMYKMQIQFLKEEHEKELKVFKKIIIRV